MRIRIYTVGKKEFIGEYRVKSVYESTFYHKNMPILSAKSCREILNKVYPHFKADKELFVFENVDTGYTGVQHIYRRGTILNF